MFYNKQQIVSKEKYHQFLGIVGSLSNLFSDSNVPFGKNEDAPQLSHSSG